MSHVAVLVPGRVSVTQRSGEQTPLWGLLIIPTLLLLLITLFPLLSECCPILTVSIFSLSLWEQSVLDSVNFSCEKRCREGENYHMSFPVAFHFGHNHCRSISHNHSDHHRVSLSQSMSTDTIRARYLGPLHFVDHDGWDQTSFTVFLALAY